MPAINVSSFDNDERGRNLYFFFLLLLFEDLAFVEILRG